MRSKSASFTPNYPKSPSRQTVKTCRSYAYWVTNLTSQEVASGKCSSTKMKILVGAAVEAFTHLYSGIKT